MSMSMYRSVPFAKLLRLSYPAAAHSLAVRQLNTTKVGAIAIRGYDSYQYQSQKRFLSSTNSNKSSNSGTDENPPIDPVFPWRENASTPLERVAINDDLSGIAVDNRGSTFFKKIMSAIELKEFGLLSFFITRDWEKELSSHASWAFQVAVCGLVHRTLGIRPDNIQLCPESGIIIDAMTSIDEMQTYGDVDSDVVTSCDDESAINEDIDVDATENDDDDHNDENEDETQQYATEFIQGMIEENFLALYKPLASMDSSKYHITLALKPIASRLEHIFVVPGFTRQDVNSNPSLKGAYQAIEKAYADKASMETIRDMSKELLRKTSHFGHKRSIIMDVSIDCMEVFQIKDVGSGEVIQGQKGDEDADADEMPHAEMTTHLVRFEMVTSKGQNMNDRVIGSWKIIDIDDLMHGNVWH